MATTTLNKEINGVQLIAELKAAGRGVTSEAPLLRGDQLTVEGTLTDQQLADAVAAHVLDRGYGLSAGQKRKRELAAKADLTATELKEAMFLWLRGTP